MILFLRFALIFICVTNFLPANAWCNGCADFYGSLKEKLRSKATVEPVPNVGAGVYVAWYPVNTHMKLFIDNRVVETVQGFRFHKGARAGEALVRTASRGINRGDAVGPLVLFEIRVDQEQILKMKEFMARENQKNKLSLLLQDCSGGACKAVYAGTESLIRLPMPVASVPALAGAYLSALRLFPNSIVKSVQIIGKPGATARTILGPLLTGGDWVAASVYLGSVAAVAYWIEIEVYDPVSKWIQKLLIPVKSVS